MKARESKLKKWFLRNWTNHRETYKVFFVGLPLFFIAVLIVALSLAFDNGSTSIKVSVPVSDQAVTTTTWAVTPPSVVYEDGSIKIYCDGTTGIYKYGQAFGVVPNSTKCTYTNK